MKIPKSVKMQMDPLLVMLTEGPEAVGELLKDKLRYKASKTIRALPGTDNAYKASLRKELRQANSIIKKILKKSNTNSVEELLSLLDKLK